MTRSGLRVGLVGWNGKRNAGDDAMTAALVDGLEDIAPGSRIVALAGKRYLPPTRAGARFVGLPHFEAAMAVPLLRRILLRQGFGRALVGGSGLDLLVFGGGSIFRHANTVGEYERLHLAAAARSRRLRSAAIGVSVGPFSDPLAEQRALRLLGRLDAISVRDERSYDYVKSRLPGVPCALSADLAYAFAGAAAPSDRPGGARGRGVLVGVALRAGVREAEQKALVGWLRGFAEVSPGVSIRFVAMCAHRSADDRRFADRLVEAVALRGRLDVAGTSYSGDPRTAYDGIAGCDLVVAVRLHGLLFGIAAGRKTIAYPYHAKVTDLAAQAGLDPECLLHDVGQLTSLEWAPARVLERVRPTSLERRKALAMSAQGHLEVLRRVLEQ